MAQLMPLPLTGSCFSKIQIGFTFLVPAHLGSPRKVPLNGCVCVVLEYVTSHSVELNILYLVGVQANRQRQCCATGNLTVALALH